ncbi:hypothetical protein GCM10009626_30350 [Brachybacterium sacelli]
MEIVGDHEPHRDHEHRDEAETEQREATPAALARIGLVVVLPVGGEVHVIGDVHTGSLSHGVAVATEVL